MRQRMLTGKWPSDSVRRIIESIATGINSLRFELVIYNSQGRHGNGNGGDQERELAAKYKLQANEIRFEAPFTARVLDDLSDSYNRDARVWDERSRWEE